MPPYGGVNRRMILYSAHVAKRLIYGKHTKTLSFGFLCLPKMRNYLSMVEWAWIHAKESIERLSLSCEAYIDIPLLLTPAFRFGAYAPRPFGHMGLCHGTCLRQLPRQPFGTGPRRKAIERYRNMGTDSVFPYTIVKVRYSQPHKSHTDCALDYNTDLLDRTFALAHRALERGERPVSALLVRSGEAVAEATDAVFERSDPTAHAERILVSDYCTVNGFLHLRGYELYCFIEPCLMCCGAIHWAKLDRVVYSLS